MTDNPVGVGSKQAAWQVTYAGVGILARAFRSRVFVALPLARGAGFFIGHGLVEHYSRPSDFDMSSVSCPIQTWNDALPSLSKISWRACSHREGSLAAFKKS